MSEARAVLFDSIGYAPHWCHWCGRPVRWGIGQRGNKVDLVTADHVNSDHLDDRPENLVPACGTCNGNRKHAVRDDEPHIVRANGTRLRGAARTCDHCKTPFVAYRDQRYCQRSCGDAARRENGGRYPARV